MRIAFICSEYPPERNGGIGTWVQMLGRRLVSRGHVVRVLGHKTMDSPLPEREIDEGVEVTRLPVPAGRLSSVRARMAIHRVLQGWSSRGEIDVIEVPDYQGWAACWRPMRAPIVARYHGSSAYFGREMNQAIPHSDFWIERASLRRAEFHCSVSRYTAERTASVFNYAPKSCEIIYNPVVPGPARRQGPTASTVVFSGTLAVKKGVVELLEAWRRVADEIPEARLHIYGKDGKSPDGGSMREYLSRMAGELMDRSVFLHGHVNRDRVLAEIEGARAAVFPSFAEAFALAPLEAMASGCPTIYSKRGSGPELIRDGEDGILIEPSRPDEIASALTAILQSEELAARLGEGGRRRVLAEFTMDRIVEQNERFYERCIRAARG